MSKDDKEEEGESNLPDLSDLRGGAKILGLIYRYALKHPRFREYLKDQHKVYEVEEFLELVDRDKWKPVRVVKSRKRKFQFLAFVEEVVLEDRWDFGGHIVFRFEAEKDDSMMRMSEMGLIPRRLRIKAQMLKEGDQIIIRGKFKIGATYHIIYIRDIERL